MTLATVPILDVTSGDRSELPAHTRTVDVPDELDEATGACVAVAVNGDEIRFRWTHMEGGHATGWLTATPLSSRKPGQRCMVESTDLDDRGRRMWWLSTVEAAEGASAPLNLRHR